MITYTRGNIFNSSMDCLVNPINCVGVMGNGLALQFKYAYPEMFQDYKNRCAKGLVRVGQPYIYTNDLNKVILNFPTKKHWMQNSNINDIENGLFYLVCNVDKWDIQSIAIPPLGCGKGKLEWTKVKPLMEHILKDLTIPIEIYTP